MSTSKAALDFDSSLPRTYSDSWREAYGQGTDTPRLSSYQAPDGEPVVFSYDSISLGGGQNVDTAEYPYGFWSNTRLGEKPHTIRIKGHLIGENYIGERNKLVSALQVPTDDDTPGFIDLPLWGRFKVVVETWDVDEDKKDNGSSDLSIEFKRAGCSDTARFDVAAKSLTKLNVEAAVENVKTAASASFAKALKAGKDANTLAAGFGSITNKLAAVIGRVQGAVSFMNDMTNKVNSVTSLIAQGVRLPTTLTQAAISAVFGIVDGVLEIRNAADETASYFQGIGNNLDSSVEAFGSSSASEQFVNRNEKNVVMNFLTASNYELEEEAITEQQWNTKEAIENFYKTVAFGASVQLLVKLNADTHTYENMQGLWSLLEKLEESINKEDSNVYAAVEDARIACAEVLLSQEYDTELSRLIRKEMPLLALALQLGCDAERIRNLNAIADSFLIKGEIIYV